MASLRQIISNRRTAMAVVVVAPRSSGWKFPRKPASIEESRMYVTSAITGMYMSGELRSSRGGRNIDEYCCHNDRDVGIVHNSWSKTPVVLSVPVRRTCLDARGIYSALYFGGIY